jgi:hypothetical protein
METDNMSDEEFFKLEDKARKEHGRYYCRRCIDRRIISPANEQFSMGCYAGMLCESCWENDGRNHDRDFDPMDAGESYSEDDY